jgi:hypothetical protein
MLGCMEISRELHSEVQPVLEPSRARSEGRPGLLWFFLFVIFTIKLSLYLVDPDVKVVLGDSGSYIATALSGWVPPDRSFTYGLFLGYLLHAWYSLKLIVMAQVALSTLAAMLLTWVLDRVLRVSTFMAGACGIACALEPLQLLSERYILSEAISTCFFAIVICLALKYLTTPKLRLLPLIAVAATLLVSFRIYFLPAMLVTSVFLPIAANIGKVPWRVLRRYLDRNNAPAIDLNCDQSLVDLRFSVRLIAGRLRFHSHRETAVPMPIKRVTRFALHVFIAIVSLQVALLGLRDWYGYKIHGPAAYIEEDGVILLAALSPVVHESDFRNRELGHRVFSNLRMPQHEKLSRVWNMWAKGGMLDALTTEVNKMNPGNPWAVNKVAKRTAIRAVMRHPIETVDLAVSNVLEYLSIKELKVALVANEYVDSPVSPNYQQLFSQYFGWKLPYQRRTGLVREWHERSAPWCFYLVLCPALATLALLIPRMPRRLYLLYCVLSAWPLWCVSTLLPLEVAPRYFTGLAWLLILVTGLIVQGLADLWTSRSKTSQSVTDQESAITV